MESKRKAFGIGFGKTGTKSLGQALEILGYNHQSFDESILVKYSEGRYDELFAIVDSHDSLEDFPWPFMIEELDRRYPDSLFILTVRKSTNIWYRSLCRHAARWPDTKPSLKLAYGHGEPRDDPQHHKRLYEEHNRRVKDYFEHRPDQLLVLCLEQGMGWSELCSFLNTAVPKVPFPAKNRAPTLFDRSIGRLHIAASCHVFGYRWLWQLAKRMRRHLFRTSNRPDALR